MGVFRVARTREPHINDKGCQRQSSDPIYGILTDQLPRIGLGLAGGPVVFG